MEPKYYIGQLCAVAAWIVLLSSYHAKRENKVIFMQIISSILYIIDYFCLGAMAGFWISIFELVKSIGYYKTDKDKYIFFFTLPVYLVIICFTEFDAITLLAVFGSIIDSFAMLNSRRTMVLGGVISYTLWVVYDLAFFDFASAVSDAFVIASNLSILAKGYNKYLHRSNVYTVKPIRISINTIHAIEKLDKKLLDKTYRWDEETIKKLTKDRKHSYILVKDRNRIVGYVNFLNLKEEVYRQMLESYEFYDNFEVEDLAEFIKNRKIYLNLNSIILNDDYANSNTTEKIEAAINRYIRNMKRNRYYIQELCCFAINHTEIKILENLGFEKVRDISNECFLYRKTFD